MARVSQKQLVAYMSRIASLQNRPAKGKGSLHLEHVSVYGGWDLVEICNDTGAENSLIGNTFAGRGRLKSHEMETFLLGMLCALEGTNYWPIKAK